MRIDISVWETKSGEIREQAYEHGEASMYTLNHTLESRQSKIEHCILRARSGVSMIPLKKKLFHAK